MNDPFISLVEEVFYTPLWSSLSQEINVAHCFHVGNTQWQIKRYDMIILSYHEDIHGTRHFTNTHRLCHALKSQISKIFFFKFIENEKEFALFVGTVIVLLE